MKSGQLRQRAAYTLPQSLCLSICVSICVVQASGDCGERTECSGRPCATPHRALRGVGVPMSARVGAVGAEEGPNGCTTILCGVQAGRLHVLHARGTGRELETGARGTCRAGGREGSLSEICFLCLLHNCDTRVRCVSRDAVLPSSSSVQSRKSSPSSWASLTCPTSATAEHNRHSSRAKM